MPSPGLFVMPFLPRPLATGDEPSRCFIQPCLSHFTQSSDLALGHAAVGVQFHPESIASSGGYRLLAAFLANCGANHLPNEAELNLLEAQLLRLDQKFPDQVHV